MNRRFNDSMNSRNIDYTVLGLDARATCKESTSPISSKAWKRLSFLDRIKLSQPE